MTTSASAKPGKPSVWRAFAQPSAWTMFFFGFASGMPFLLVAGTLAYWLTENGLELKNITLIASAGMTYTLKFLWAPLVDRWRLPLLGRLGQRRGWLLLALAVVIAGLLLMAHLTPGKLAPFIWVTLLTAFAGATLDIAVDAYRIEIAPQESQGALLATYSLGYRIALIITGMLALVLADHVPWPQVYVAMAFFMLIPVVAVLIASEPDVVRVRMTTWAQGLQEGVVEPFLDFFRRFGAALALALLAFILLAKISDQSLGGGIMAPFYLGQGFTKTEIATVTKFYGIWVGLGGVFLAGIAIARWGVKWPLLAGIVLGAISNLLYVWLIGADGDLWKLTMVISGENLAQGFQGTTLVAFLSALVNQRFTATQYALFSSLVMLPGKLLSAISGGIVEQTGYGVYFWITALVAVPAVVLFFWLAPRIRFGGGHEAATGVDVPDTQA
ncbi:MFS transporter [Pseudoxanthomonas sp. PXM01]|uniref:AmpG family muropeptide MFS transporter n=1 Tax=Pseudoxanthomonas sp. PXM01 TaxID=2769295 RepID=UPI0017805586|nr:MFS transporter [Pseudoxanthomonas sp. PXM01]MBD9471146.1 MFS transporter [Pseudoxanthomonas sp. PXM01]